MYKIKVIPLVLIYIAIVTLFAASPKPVSAFSFSDIFKHVESLFKDKDQDKKDQIAIDAKMDLAPEGDINHDDKLTAGDIVKFTYTITNPTDNSYQILNLHTNIDTSILNNISNIQGAASINEDNRTIIIPNINIKKNQILVISFEAQINFNKNEDMSLSTEPKLIDKNGKNIISKERHTIQILKMDEEAFNKSVHIKRK